uniref:Mitochondrial import inner membrane translocase subunit n=1 Tax=Prasinoderma singulare TaxID=676789 RepID=A0A7S3BEP4_9VIRI
MPGMPNFSAAQEKEMNKELESMQLRDSLSLYNRLSKRCFDDCVSSFRTRTLDRGEETCVVRCAEKFLKHMARVTVRFGEVQQQQMGAAGAGGAAK